MVRTISAFALASVAAMSSLASAQTSPEFTPDQKGYIVYHQCMMQAAIRASHTEVKDEEIFGLAKAQCAQTRAQVIVGQEGNGQYIAALDAADMNKATNFPSWIKRVRERRRSRDAASAAPNGVSRQ